MDAFTRELQKEASSSGGDSSGFLRRQRRRASWVSRRRLPRKLAGSGDESLNPKRRNEAK